MRWWRSWPCASRCWPRSSRPSIRKISRASGVRSARLAARAAAHQLSSHGQGRRQLRLRSRLGGAGGRFRRRRGNPGPADREIASSAGSESQVATSGGDRLASHELKGRRRLALPQLRSSPAALMVAGSAERLGPAMTLRRSSLHQFQSTHTMNQSAIPTGISQSISASNSSFTATDLHSASLAPRAPEQLPRLGKLDDSSGRPFL